MDLGDEHRFDGASMNVVVVGDGPAGSAAAAALHRAGLSTTLVGADAAWHATYGAWLDDISERALLLLGGDHTSIGRAVASVRVHAETEHIVERPYLVLDNEVIRSTLRRDVDHVTSQVVSVRHRPGGGALVALETGNEVPADLVIDATGWPSRLLGGAAAPMAWQTAWGVVLDEPPEGRLGKATIMDWSPPGGCDEPIPTFAYSLPVEDGWLVEETVLASTPVVEPDRLRLALARRLGWSPEQLDRTARRIERVCIPMGAPMRGAGGPGGLVVPFGAAAGLAHPATGYQVAASLDLAPALASAVASRAAAMDVAPDRRSAVAGAAAETIWSAERQRTRRLHEYGLDVLLRLDAATTRSFFETFFDLPVGTWRPQMRIDASPREVSAVMTRMFASAPWRLRWRLMRGDPRRLGAVVRSPRLAAET